MSSAPGGPGANGQDTMEAMRAAALAKAASAPLGVPVTTALPVAAAKGQATRYPYLQAFAARAQFPPSPRIQIARAKAEPPKPAAYEIHLGMCCAADLGRQLSMTLIPGMPARELAVLLRGAADALDAMANQVDQDNPAAAEGPRLGLVAGGAGQVAGYREGGAAAELSTGKPDAEEEPGKA